MTREQLKRHRSPEEFESGLWYIWPENWHIPIKVNTEQYKKMKNYRTSTWMLLSGDRVVRYMAESGKWISLANILFENFKNGKGVLRVQHRDDDRFNWLPENIIIKTRYTVVQKKVINYNERESSGENYNKMLTKDLKKISRYHTVVKIELLTRYAQNNFRNNKKLEKIDLVLTDEHERRMKYNIPKWELPRFDYMERAAREIASHKSRKAEIIKLLIDGRYGYV
jgi:hypothetical protein